MCEVQTKRREDEETVGQGASLEKTLKRFDKPDSKKVKFDVAQNEHTEKGKQQYGVVLMTDGLCPGVWTSRPENASTKRGPSNVTATSGYPDLLAKTLSVVTPWINNNLGP